MVGGTLAPVTFASDPAATAGRIRQLAGHMGEYILDLRQTCICRHLEQCRRSAAGSRTQQSRTDFAAGQLSHVGHHYALAPLFQDELMVLV